MKILPDTINISCINIVPTIKKKLNYFFKDLEQDTFCYSESSIQDHIDGLKNIQAQIFFNNLYAKSPEKCKTLIFNDNFKCYCNQYIGIFFDKYNSIHKEDIKTFEAAINKLSADEIKDVINKTTRRNGVCTTGEDLIKTLLLYSNDKKAYNYIINSPVVSENTVYSSGYTKDLFQYVCNMNYRAVCNLDYNSLIEIEKGIIEDYDYSVYTINSNFFLSIPEETERLQNFLRKNTNDNDITAYRGEKSSWMFNSIPIDDTLSEKIKSIVESNPQTKEDKIYPDTLEFAVLPEQTVYDYILNKEKLTLADAIICAKYLDDNLIKQILKKINNAEVLDIRFKSFTLDKKFAENWAKKKYGISTEYDDMVSMVSKTKIKAGNQVGYVPRNKQYEFVINNNLKKMTFSNAQYDRKTNTFFFDSEIKALN